MVRDPYETHDSFGAHNNARLRAFLDAFGFDYDFASSTECYRSGRFDETLLLALARFDGIQKIMLPSLGEERRATYSPFIPISPTTGRVLYVPTLERHVHRGTITFRDEDGSLAEVPVTGGHVKLQWRPDWALRWTALQIDYEMSGKDLIDSVRLSNQVCKVLGGTPPAGFHYELFMDENNQKISKTKGNGLTMEEWLRYGALWGFIRTYIPGASADTQPLLDRLADFAINYYEDFVKPNKRFRAPDAMERAAIEDLAARFRALPAGCQDAELSQAEVYEAGKTAGFEPLRLWFTALYEVLLGQSQGPRFGSFAAIFGLDRTLDLIDRALSGGLVNEG